MPVMQRQWPARVQIRLTGAIGASLLQDWTQFAAAAVFGIANRLYARTRFTDSMPVHNLLVSNVPGPQVGLYMLGCEVKAMCPLGPIFHGSGLNITAMSLQGKLEVGVLSCPDLLPYLWEMVDEFAVAMEELLRSPGSRPVVPLMRISAFLWQHMLAWVCLAVTRSRARC